MSDSELSSVEDLQSYDESMNASEEEDRFLEEEEDEEFEEPYSEEDVEDDEELYQSKKPKSANTSTGSIKLKIKPPSKPVAKVTKVQTPPRGVAKRKTPVVPTRPSRPSKLSQEITKEPALSRSRRGKTQVNYNDEINDDDLLEEDDYDMEESNQGSQVPRDNDHIDDEGQFNDEDVIPTPALDDLSDDDLESYSDINQRQPDLTKMTERQRAMLDDNTTVSADEFDSDSSQISTNSHLAVLKSKNSQFLSLSNNIRKRNVLTEEENQIRRAEIARKRKNLSEKKLEEEKQDTINKLLKRRAKTTRTKKGGPVDNDADDDGIDGMDGKKREKSRRPQPQHKALFRWVSNKHGLKLGIPEEFVKF